MTWLGNKLNSNRDLLKLDPIKFARYIGYRIVIYLSFKFSFIRRNNSCQNNSYRIKSNKQSKTKIFLIFSRYYQCNFICKYQITHSLLLRWSRRIIPSWLPNIADSRKMTTWKMILECNLEVCTYLEIFKDGNDAKNSNKNVT